MTTLIHAACTGCPRPASASLAEVVVAVLVALMPVLVLGLVAVLADRYGT